MVHDAADVPAGPASLDRVGVEFSEERLVSDAGLLLAATLADRLGVEELVNESVWLAYRTPGAALPGRKVMSLVHGMLAGAEQHRFRSVHDQALARKGNVADAAMLSVDSLVAQRCRARTGQALADTLDGGCFRTCARTCRKS